MALFGQGDIALLLGQMNNQLVDIENRLVGIENQIADLKQDVAVVSANSENLRIIAHNKDHGLVTQFEALLKTVRLEQFHLSLH